jgi:hypothetical protein
VIGADHDVFSVSIGEAAQDADVLGVGHGPQMGQQRLALSLFGELLLADLDAVFDRLARLAQGALAAQLGVVREGTPAARPSS